jgi:hypothetical protein
MKRQAMGECSRIDWPGNVGRSRVPPTISGGRIAGVDGEPHLRSGSDQSPASERVEIKLQPILKGKLSVEARHLDVILAPSVEMIRDGRVLASIPLR